MARAIALVVQQGRLWESFYGVHCFLFHRPSLARVQNKGAVDHLRKQHGNVVLYRGDTVNKRGLMDRFSDGFPIDALPDNIIVRTHSIAYETEWLVLGDYGESSGRMFFLTRNSIKELDYYPNLGGIRHIHSIHRLDEGTILVSTGDRKKLLDTWNIRGDSIDFSDRLMRRNGGFTASARVGNNDYFGTDYSGRPNYILRLRDRKKYFFPKEAYTKFTLAFTVLEERYIAAINVSLAALGGRQAISIFDTQNECFIYSKEINRVDSFRFGALLTT